MPDQRLTARERDVLRLIAEGQGNDQIAAALGIATDTVRNHATTLYARLGIDPFACNPRVVAAVLYTRAELGAGEGS